MSLQQNFHTLLCSITDQKVLKNLLLLCYHHIIEVIHSLLRHKKEKLKNILPVSLVKTEIDISRHSYYIVYIIYLFDMLPDTLISFITSSSIENDFLKQ